VTRDSSSFQRDPLVAEHADRDYLGVNIAVAWPLPPELEPAYRSFERAASALDPGLYVYPHATTHVTVLTAINFKQHPDPDAALARDVDCAARELADFLVASTRDISPFKLEVGAPVLTSAAAFLPIKNDTGEIARVRERALAFCRTESGLLANASVPRAIHSTILRFRDPPRDAAAFERAFDSIARSLHFGTMTIDRLLVTLETKPYMRDGRVAHEVRIGSSAV
jgi:hypothetical protein